MNNFKKGDTVWFLHSTWEFPGIKIKEGIVYDVLNHKDESYASYDINHTSEERCTHKVEGELFKTREAILDGVIDSLQYEEGQAMREKIDTRIDYLDEDDVDPIESVSLEEVKSLLDTIDYEYLKDKYND